MRTTTLDEQSLSTARSVAQARSRRGRRVPLNQIILHLILIIVALVALMPMVWCVFASFKHFRELVSSPDLLPHVWTLDSYKAVFGVSGLWTGFRNTIIVTFSVT